MTLATDWKQVAGELEDILNQVIKERDEARSAALHGEPWLLDLVRAFSPKEIPLDLDASGDYLEATTRWGPNPIYAAVPLWIREQVGR